MMRLFPQFDGFTATEMVKQPSMHSPNLCFLTWAYIECYSYSMDPIWIPKAQDLTELSFELFGDEQGALVQSQISEIKLFGIRPFMMVLSPRRTRLWPITLFDCTILLERLRG